MSKRLLSAVIGIALVGARPRRAGPARGAAGGGPRRRASAFTADDMLKVVTASVLDLSDDGRYVAATARRTLDNAETDNRRYGDPSYLSPSAVRLMVIDTETGQTSMPLADLADIRQAAWSHDATRPGVHPGRAARARVRMGRAPARVGPRARRARRRARSRAMPAWP